jgi:hypothetical protein
VGPPVRETIAALLVEVGAIESARRLDLASLQVVLLHEKLEAAFAIRIRAREVTPEAFDSLEALEALVRSKLAERDR